MRPVGIFPWKKNWNLGPLLLLFVSQFWWPGTNLSHLDWQFPLHQQAFFPTFSYQNTLRCHKSKAMESREHEVKPLMLQANIFPLLKFFFFVLLTEDDYHRHRNDKAWPHWFYLTTSEVILGVIVEMSYNLSFCTANQAREVWCRGLNIIHLPLLRCPWQNPREPFNTMPYMRKYIFQIC